MEEMIKSYVEYATKQAIIDKLIEYERKVRELQATNENIKAILMKYARENDEMKLEIARSKGERNE